MLRPSPSGSRASHLFIERLEHRMLLSAGDLDTSFSGNGKATVDFGDGILVKAFDVAVQSDGKTVVVGGTTVGSNSRKFAVARFNVNGTLDTTFGPNLNGRILANFGGASDFSQAYSVEIQPDGGIVVAGSGGGDLGLGVARLLPNGTFDSSFSGNGKLVTDFGGDALVQSGGAHIAFQTDGSIIAAGTTLGGILDLDFDIVVIRIKSNGSIDKNFGRSGMRAVGFGEDEYIGALATDDKNRIILVGNHEPDDGSNIKKLAIARLTPNGSLDKTFSGDGKLIDTFPGLVNAEGNGVVIQPEGKIVVAAKVGPDDQPNNYQFGMARYDETGALDPTFGQGGTGREVLGFGGNDQANDIVEGYNDRLIVAGTASGKFAIAAFSRDGRLDGNFGTGGRVVTSFDSDRGLPKIAIGPGPRRFVVAGGDAFRTARYLDVGANEISINSLDTNAYEAGANAASFIVSRVERLPTPITVGFTIGGTAGHPGDYTSPNISGPIVDGNIGLSATAMGPMRSALQPAGLPGGIPIFGQVTIPANETFAVVTVTPVNDAIVEGNETILVTLNDTDNYDLGSRKSVTLDIIDDETVTVLPLADALVKQGKNAAENFGPVRSLQSRAKTDNNRRSYLKFSLLGHSNKTITSIKLRLFGNLSGPSEDVTTGIFYVVNTTWDESTITWNNKPANINPVLATTQVSDNAARWYEWDVTAYLKSDIEAGYDAVTLLVRNTTTSDEFATFNSREANTNQPQLVVTYA